MKKLTAIIIAFTFIVSLVGCENRPDKQSKETKLNAEKEETALNEEVVLPQAVEKLINELSGTEFEVNEFYLSPETDQRFEHEIVNTYVLQLKNANNVYVFEFESEEDANEHAGYYNEDGSGYNSPNISMIIDYIAPVRMWQHGECIIEYAHQDNRAYLPICKIFGAPFVGKTSIVEEIEPSDVQYIRTNQQGGEFVNNTIVLIESAEALADYYEENRETFDLERNETVYSDTTIGFLDACDTYTAEWFEQNNLLMVILSEGSGSIRHKITSVTVRNYDLESFNDEDFALQINVQRYSPEVQTCDMAEWHIMIGVPKRDLPETMGLGMNEVWDTDFGWMMEGTQSQPEKEFYTAEILPQESGSGEPSDYEALANEYLSYYKNLAFISYEIASIYSPEEAYELTELDSVLRNTTLYKVHVYYDHINDCETDYYLNLAHAGNEHSQYLGYPIYEVGQRFMSAVFGSSDTWRVPVTELEFVSIDTELEEFAYHLCSEMEISDEELTFINMSENEKTLITSTENNPMIFTHKFSRGELSDFIKRDWSERGFENIN